MKKTLLTLIFLCALCYSLPAQDTTWFNNRWKECPKNIAEYYHLESKEGPWLNFVDYYKSNNQVQNTGQYYEGLKEGKFIWYHENGQISGELTYIKGKKEGRSVSYYDDGQLSGEEYYLNDLREGTTLNWHPDGTPSTKWEFKNGEMNRSYMKFNPENGKWEEEEVVTSDVFDYSPENMVEELQKDGDESKDPEPDDFLFLDKEPNPQNLDEVKKCIHEQFDPKIEYPLSNKVVLRVLVGKTGMVEKHIIIKDPHPALTELVITYLYNLNFTPAIIAGEPVKAWTTLPFDFHLIRPEKGE